LSQDILGRETFTRGDYIRKLN